ncbi:WD40-repeat containing protein [Chondrus crispus]|uniref:WD40-repeat containing protein n=1 Tax=Chondrus crispus TaxID=2769 RepID=R7QPT1_CHOCR|nr:WD40-repeat containing protein [Chondrus crispus]CDF39798.1 WD40-repeat containing protein [Chondrus crispus]|eukprot:XP_005710092.1 WD40-repeat containing protein [Chondrus crispus]
MEAVRTELHVISEVRLQRSGKEVFIPSFSAEHNPPSVYVDLGSVENHPAPDTFERKLKAAVLRNGSTSHVGATAVGQAGVGKTCALRAISLDREIVARFPGGVYFSTLGQDAREGQLKQELCNAVKVSGGREEGGRLSKEADLNVVLAGVQSWFANRVCLFIFDDVWTRNNNDKKILLKLSRLANTAVIDGEPRSRVLYSTRDPSLTHLGEPVRFSARENRGEAARNILVHTSGASLSEVENEISREAFCEILDTCRGLPLALNIAGVNVKQWRGDRVGDIPELWVSYLQQIEEDKEPRAIGAKEPEDEYESLHTMLRSSIRSLDSNGRREGVSFGEMHRGLCVMKKQDVIPLTVLRDLWETGDVRSAEKYAREMNSVGLVDIHFEVKSKSVEMGVRLHDLTHDFAMHEAKQMEGSSWNQKWYRKVVDSYRKEREVVEAVVEDQGAQASDAREQYFFENICRLLLKGEMMNELRGLLVSARWVIKVLLRKAVWQLEAAVKDVTEVSRQGTGTIGTAGTAEDEGLSTIGLVMKAARLSAPFCDEHVAGICFQLYDRTMHKRELRGVEAFLSEIKLFAPQPWLLPLRPCLPRAGERLLETFKTPALLRNVAFDSDGTVVGWAYGGEVTAALKVFTFTQQGSVVKRISNNVYGGWRSDEGETVMQEETETEISRPCQVLEEGREAAQGSLCQDEASAEVARPSVEVPEERLQRTERKNWIARVGHDIKKKVGACYCLRKGCEVVSTSENVAQDSESRIRSTSGLSGAGRVSATGAHDSVSGSSGAESEGGTSISESVTRCMGRRVTAAFVSGNGSHAILGYDNGAVVVLCMKRKEIIQCFKGHLDEITAVAMSGDGKRVASGSYDGTERVWNVETGLQIGDTMTGHTARVMSVAMSGDGKRVVSGSSDRTVRVWDGETGCQIGETMTGHTAGITSVAMSGDGKRVVSGSHDKTVRVWDGETGCQIGETMTGHTRGVMSVAMNGDGKRVVSGSWDNTVRVWDGETGCQIVETMTGHTDWVRSVAMSGDGKRVVSGSSDRTVRVWDGETGCQIGETMTGHTAGITSVAMNGDGKRVVSGSSDRTVRVWDGKTGCQVGETMTGHTDWVRSVAMNGDGKRVVSGSWDKTVRLWDSETGCQIRETMTGHTDWVRSVAMNGDGKRVVSGSDDKTVRVWDGETGCQVGETMTGHTAGITNVAMSGDGKRVVSGSWDKTVRVWDGERGVKIGETMTGHTAGITSVAMSGDGKRVVSGSSDRTLRVWDGETGCQVGETMIGHTDRVTSVAMSGDGKRIWSRGAGGTLRGWKQRSSVLDMSMTESGIWVLETCGICEVSDKVILKQGDGSEITLAHLECSVMDFVVNMECETVVVGIRNGSVGIMSVISSDDASR